MVNQMPTFAEVRAYVLGVRLEQAQKLTFENEPAALHGCLLRLDAAASSIRHTAWGDALSSRLIKVLRPAMRKIERQLTSFEGDRLDKVYLDCRSQLEKMDAILCASASTAASDEELMRWYDLGREITSGSGGDGTLPIKDPPPRRAWEWDRPEKLNAQISDLGVSLDMLFPEVPSTREWYEYKPLRWLEWIRIESGIEAMSSATTRNTQGEANADFPQLGLTNREREIVQVIRQAGHRLTTLQVLSALAKLRTKISEGMTKQSLRKLVLLKVLDNRSDTKPRGYGLRTWELPQ